MCVVIVADVFGGFASMDNFIDVLELTFVRREIECQVASLRILKIGFQVTLLLFVHVFSVHVF